MAGVLCLWVHAACVLDSGDRDNMCDDCGYILFVECGKLSLAVDIVLLSSVDCDLCLSLLRLLLLCED